MALELERWLTPEDLYAYASGCNTGQQEIVKEVRNRFLDTLRDVITSDGYDLTDVLATLCFIEGALRAKRKRMEEVVCSTSPS